MWVTRIFHLLAVALLVVVGIEFRQLGVIYYLGVAVVAALLAYENAIVSAKNLSRINMAFMTMNGIISVIYIGFLVADLLVD